MSRTASTFCTRLTHTTQHSTAQHSTAHFSQAKLMKHLEWKTQVWSQQHPQTFQTCAACLSNDKNVLWVSCKVNTSTNRRRGGSASGSFSSSITSMRRALFGLLPSPVRGVCVRGVRGVQVRGVRDDKLSSGSGFSTNRFQRKGRGSGRYMAAALFGATLPV